MEFFNSLNLTQIKGGTKLKQGDLGSVLSYSLTDENGQEITSFDNKTAYINLVLDDKIWFTTTTLVDISRVTFRIDKAIPIGLYYLEIKIDDYIFPSDRDSIILIEEGSTPYDLKELVPNYDINMTLKGILSDLSQKGIDISDLNRRIAEKVNKDEVTNVMTPKGNIAYASLPTSGNEVGWYYYCPDGDGTHGAGNYVWNGTSWFFGGTGDEGYNLLKKDIVTLEATKDGTVTVEKTDFFKTVPLSQNRFNSEAEPYVIGEIYTGVKENTSKNADYYISAEMLIEPGKQYYQNFEASCVLYDSAHNYIRTIAWNESPFTADANAKYIRCSVKTVDKNTKYIGESKWANVNVIAYTGDKTEISDKSVERVLKCDEKIDVLEYQYSSNRFNKKSEENIDGYYLNKGRRIVNEAYFITHLIPVEPNTQYFKNENGDGVFYDKNKNIIKWLYPDTSGQFTTPENCAFYQTSASIGIKNKFYVSTTNNTGVYKETVALTNDGKKAVDEYILPQVDRKIEESKGSSTKVEVSSIALPYVNTAPSVEDCVVTFIDDDGDKAVYTALYPLLKEKNIKFGVALVTGKIGEASGLLTLDQLKEMHNSGHIETLSHCHTNYNKMPTLTKTQMDYQYSESKNWLKSNGFDYSAFVFPQNTTDRLSRTEARKYFEYCFTGIARNGSEFIDPSKIYRLAYGSYESYNPQISGIEGTDTLEYYKACIDLAYETGEWLIFNTHVGVTDTHTTEVQIEMLSELIDYITAKGIKILPPSEAFALKRNLVSVGDTDEEYLFIGRKGFETNLFTVQVGGFEGEALSNNSPITDFKKGMTSIITVNYSQGSSAGFPTQAGILETYRDKGYAGWSYQKWISYQTCKVYMRFWDEDTTKAWLDWVPIN